VELTSIFKSFTRKKSLYCAT